MTNIFSNNPDFYPTPAHVVEKMIYKISLKDRFDLSILEPSAGKGNIARAWEKRVIDYNSANYGYRDVAVDLDVVEKDNNLQHILRGEGFRLVHDDFLTMHTYKKYDVILMNPPFVDGDKHLLKALEMQKAGGEIVCLLNAETLNNPYSNSRKSLKQKLTDLGAEIENMGNIFSESERNTDVDVAMVYVDIPYKKPVSNILEGLRKDIMQEQEEAEPNALIDSDFLRGIVQRYNFEIRAGIELIKEYSAMQKLILQSMDEKAHSNRPMIYMTTGAADKYGDAHVSVNEYVRNVRRKYWTEYFRDEKNVGNLTTNLVDQYREKVEELADYDFSLYNIFTIRIEMNKHMIKGVEETILDLFEEFSHKHNWYDETSKNIHYYNGWKTNKSWMINKKVIIPLSGFSSWDGRIDYDYRVCRKLDDAAKVFNYLDGGRTPDVNNRARLDMAQAEGQTKKITLKYFTVTFYKKGTCHIEFTDLDLLKKFNIFGSQRKGWLPPSYGQKQYEYMTQEEQSAVNEFEGEQEYNKTFMQKDFYITETAALIQLMGGVGVA